MVGNNHAELGLPEELSVFGDEWVESKRKNIYLIPGREGIRVLKELRIGAEQAKLIGELLTYLNGSGLTPELINSKSGAPYFWKKGNRYFLTSFLPGRTADYYRLEDLQAAIRAMAALHRHSSQFLITHPVHSLFLKFDPVRIWRQRLNEMEICRERAIRLRNWWSNEYLLLWYFCWNQASKAIKEMETIRPGEPEVICYHDWAFHNLIINNGEAALVDFDYIIVDQPVHDRVNLISRYLRLHQWSSEALLKSLWNFDRFYPWKAGELRKLRIYLTFPYEYWILGRQYFLEHQPWSERYFRQQWEWKVTGFKKQIKLNELIELIE